MTMTQEMAAPDAEEMLDLELSPASRSHRLRASYWQRTHLVAVVRKALIGCGENTLVGHARDFATLLEASEPFIQAEELIVGSCLALLQDRKSLNLGYYNPHYPPGYVTLLRLGLPGIRDEARRRLEGEKDADKADFLGAVALAYDAACKHVARYADHARRLAADEPSPRRADELKRIAAICDELASAAPSSFHAALQLVQFVRILGGNGCLGRVDQWLYPFYARDIASGALTPEAAQELLECLFIKMNEFGSSSEVAPLVTSEGQPMVGVSNDDLRNIALAGQTPLGQDACNSLTLMCLQASARLMLPEPKLNVRFFPGTPRRLLHECCRVLAKGANILAIFNDEVVIPALGRLGIPIEDARDYCNDGCSELIIGGKGTIRFWVHDSLAVLTDTVLDAVEAPYASFDALLSAFKARLTPFMPDDHGQDEAISHPFFAASIEDCLAEASATGARYSIYGSILAQVGNTSDGLAAIKRLVYEDHAVSWGDLVAALRANYEGYEALRQMLLHRAPKYGNDDDAVDAITREITEYFCNGVHLHACNPEGYGPKRAAGLMCFGIQRKRDLPASPDGRRQGDLTANSFSPAVGMDHSGPTAVLKSVAKVDLTRASHGSVLDIALHSSVFRGEEGAAKLTSLVQTFLSLPCTATLQLNVIDRETLLRARADPSNPEFRTLIVRVWGFSAVFVDLPAELQDHVLARTEHA
jgi:pyruvate-formate lyase